jgi:DNA repair exonuclease SbcCD ATPase subunit
MADVVELERRITAALDRIGGSLERLPGELPTAPPAGDPEELDRLREALEAEKVVSAQLEERIKAVHTKTQAQITALEDRIADLAARSRDAEAETQSLRKTNQQLRQSLESLRAAQANGVTEPHLINQAMVSELEGLRAARDGDRAELDAILGELKPLLEERSDA